MYHQDKKESVTRKKDLVYVTMEFFNEEGRKVGELKTSPINW